MERSSRRDVIVTSEFVEPQSTPPRRFDHSAHNRGDSRLGTWPRILRTVDQSDRWANTPSHHSRESLQRESASQDQGLEWFTLEPSFTACSHEQPAPVVQFPPDAVVTKLVHSAKAPWQTSDLTYLAAKCLWQFGHGKPCVLCPVRAHGLPACQNSNCFV